MMTILFKKFKIVAGKSMAPTLLKSVFTGVLIALTLFFVLNQRAIALVEPWNKNLKLKFIEAIDPIVSGVRFGIAKDMVVDVKHRELFVLDNKNKRIVIMNLDGAFLFSVDFSTSNIKHPSGLAVTDEGRIYVSDGRRIAILSYNGKYIEDLDTSTIPGFEELTLQNIALEGDMLYIGFFGKVAVFDTSTNEFLRFLGEDVIRNAVMAVDTDFVYTLDVPSFSVTVVDKESGEMVRRFGSMSGLFGGFSQPVDIAIDTLKGRIYVPDHNRTCVIVFNREGIPIFEFGHSYNLGTAYSVTVDDNGRIYVSDTSGKIKVYELIEGIEYVAPPTSMPRPRPQIIVKKVEVPEPVVEEAIVDEVEIIVRDEGRLLPVYFEINSFLLSDDSRIALTKNAKWLMRHAKATINVRGYADPTGTDEQNMVLSRKRAQAVMGYLAMKGVDPDRLIVVPFGEVGVEGMGEEGMGMSRRVDFLVIQ